VVYGPSHPQGYKGSADFSGIIEMDETNLGGKLRGQGQAWRYNHKGQKQVVVGIKQRGGQLRFFHAPNAKIEALAKYHKEHVSSVLNTS